MAHFVLVAFPTQSHINPTLQLAKRLVRTGAAVTFTTSAFAHRHMAKPSSYPVADGLLFFASFSDGFDEPFLSPTADFSSQLSLSGARNLPHLVRRSSAFLGRPVSCIIYNHLLPWAADVAADLGLPSVALWPQAAAVLAIYHHYLHGFQTTIDDFMQGDGGGPFSTVQLPNLPPLASRDFPSFLQPSNPISYVMPSNKHLFDALEKQAQVQAQAHARPFVLVNTFDALEAASLSSVEALRPSTIGPLLPSAYLNEADLSDTEYGGDLFKKPCMDYVKWMDSKPKGSVVYVSFGSISKLETRQREEIARGLKECRRPFLWVVRTAEEEEAEVEARVEGEGLIVRWCSQVEVLSHAAVGCFVTHCGWNSTAEALAAGVAAVVFPHWADQPTNAKMVEEVWGTGMRAEVGEEGVLEGGELRRCIEVVMGSERGEEMRKKAERWRSLAREAAAPETGSSEKNLRAFVEMFQQG